MKNLIKTVIPVARSRKRRGIVFVTAIVALAVMLVTAVGFISMALNQLGDAERGLKALHAIAIADAGINYMIWNQKYPNQSNTAIADANALPSSTVYTSLNPDTPSSALLSSSAEWGEDHFSAWLIRYTLPESPANQLDGYQVVARGTYRGYTRTLRALLRSPMQIIYPSDQDNPPPPPVLEHALFSGTGLGIGGNTTINGKVGCNLDLGVNSGSARVFGDALAGGRITTKNSNNITGNRYEHQPQIILTDIIQMANLYVYAVAHGNQVIDGSKTFWGTESYAYKVVYVKGDVTINSNTSFANQVLTIVAEGNVTINGSVTCGGPSDMSNLFIISPGTVQYKINGSANINATVIAPGVNAVFSGTGTANIYGAVIANQVSSSGSFNIDYRRPNPEAIIVPPPPTTVYDDQLAWTMASWEQLN
ncbi:MAG TPA: hypothetical protein VHV83_11535 [Armatimonadota bacterium]|nr:hypothetical protein [Armatimonadota bacterium]